MSAPVDPKLFSMKDQIQDADNCHGGGENVGGDIGIHKAVHIQIL